MCIRVLLLLMLAEKARADADPRGQAHLQLCNQKPVLLRVKGRTLPCGYVRRKGMSLKLDCATLERE